MSYFSIAFFIFAVLSVALYFVFPIKKYRWVVLLVSSYAFYCFFGVKYVIYLIITTFITYLSALLIDNISEKSSSYIKANKGEWSIEQKKEYKAKTKRVKRRVLIICLVVNFGILAFFKYYPVLFRAIECLHLSNESAFSSFKLLLPLGISFYTFQSMGYVIDVYKGKFNAEHNFGKVALFVSFFPQIIQGPIGFYDQLAEQLYEPHNFDFCRLKYGCELILWGFFKKIIIADRAVVFINEVTGDYSSYSGSILFLTTMMYALQLYADFSGGIDVSRGIAQIYGIDMAENFKRPYFAVNISDYWRRWHISLGAWLKNYLFYPLAVSSIFLKAGKKIRNTKFGKTKAGIHIAKVLPTSVASLIVFLVVGIWHGSNMKYVAFGLWNGIIIMLSTLLKPTYDSVKNTLKIKQESFSYTIFQIFRTFVIVFVGYVFDIAPDLQSSFIFFRKMLLDLANISAFRRQLSSLPLSKLDYVILLLGTLIIFISSLIKEKKPDVRMRERIDKAPFAIRWALIAVTIAVILVLGKYGPSYVASDFVYMQF